MADKKKTVAEIRAMTAEEADKYWNEEVPLTLFKDNDRYKDDVYVNVNGESCLIKRGVEVKVKRKFAHVLEESARRTAIAEERMRKAEEALKKGQ